MLAFLFLLITTFPTSLSENKGKPIFKVNVHLGEPESTFRGQALEKNAQNSQFVKRN